MTTPKVEILPITEGATPDPNNVNKHTAKGGKLLDNSLRKRGAFRSIASAGKGVDTPVVYAGNYTLEKAVDAGFTEIINVHVTGNQLVNVVRDDLAPNSPEAIALGIEDNEIAKQSYNPDIDILAAIMADPMMQAIQAEDRILSEIVGNMGIKGESVDAEPQIDRAAELAEKWQTASGQLWKLGDHRLLIGDCTVRENVERLMGRERASLCLTDPPYGLDEKKDSGKNSYDVYEDTQVNLIKLISGWLPIARELCNAVVFSPGVTNLWLYPHANWVMSWFYGGGQLRSSWGYNCWQPFLCYGKDPSLATGNGGRPDAVDMNTPANADDLDHPCPKPTKLWEWFIGRLSFVENEILYEPFGGSGTTIIAAHNLNRRCYAMEISEKYGAVILERFLTATNIEPELVK